jgi:hypothetical protein
MPLGAGHPTALDPGCRVAADGRALFACRTLLA